MPVLALMEAAALLPARGALIGLDLGTKTIGVAVSDPDRRLATSVETVARKRFTLDAARLLELASERRAVGFVLGLPINMDGTESKQTQKIRDFAGKLAGRLNVPMFFVDERLTSKQAERMMRESGVKAKNQRGKVDQVAAALLLESALKGAPLTEVPKP